MTVIEAGVLGALVDWPNEGSAGFAAPKNLAALSLLAKRGFAHLVFTNGVVEQWEITPEGAAVAKLHRLVEI